MQKVILTIIGLSCLIFFSCQKGTQVKANDFFIGAVVGNTSWSAYPSSSYSAKKDSLQITGVTTDGSQNLMINIPFKGRGTDTLTFSQASYKVFSTAGGVAASIAQYTLDTTQINTVSIDHSNVYEETGSFQLHFVKVSGSAAEPGTLTFTDGKFWTALPNIP